MSAVPSVLAAQTTALDKPFRFSVGASTAGIKLEAAYRFSDRWAARAWYGQGITIFADGSVGGIPYDQTLNLGGAAANIDFYPFRNRFRISGGAFFTDTFLDGRASGPFEVGDTIYNSTIRTKIELKNRVAPFVSVGYEIPIGENFLFTADAGVVYNNRLKVQIQELGGHPIDITDILSEIAEIQGNDLPVYPFLSLNLGFVF